jgi:putative component of membrane protein insertase Oxa1/YidC/SpoIIIJ protein YidD
LKKSPTGSAFTHRALTKNNAATGNEIQCERLKRLIRFAAFIQCGDEIFPQDWGLREGKNFSTQELLASYQNG